MSTLTQCPHCSAPLPVDSATEQPAERCPACQQDLTPAKAPASAGAAWWLGGEPPAESKSLAGSKTMPSLPAPLPPPIPAEIKAAPGPKPAPPVSAPPSVPRIELPPIAAPSTPVPSDPVRKEPQPDRVVFALPEPIHNEPLPEKPTLAPTPAPTEEASPWGGLAVLLGVVGFAIAWIPRLGVFGIGIGGLGLAIGLLGALVSRQRPGFGTALVGAVLSVQSMIFAAAVAFGPVKLYEPSNRPPEDGPPRQVGPYRTVVVLNTDELLETLKSNDPDARKKAIDSLSDMASGVAASVPALTDRLLNDDDERVRTGFAVALGNLGPQARSAYPALRHVQQYDGEKSVQQAATTALGKIGQPSSFDVPFIVKGLQDPRTNYRISVAETLSGICTQDNKASASYLKDSLLHEPDMRVQLFCALALWRINLRPDEVVHTYRKALSYHTDVPASAGVEHALRVKDAEAIRAEAAHALYFLGPQARLAKLDLLKALGDDSLQVVLYAAQVLWYLEPGQEMADTVVPVLGRVLRSEDAAYQGDAAKVLADIGPRATAALDDLVNGVQNAKNEPNTRALCARALAKMGPAASRAVKVLADVMQSGGGKVSEAAVFALMCIGPMAVDAVPQLIESLKDRNVEVRGRAALALAAIGDGARSAVGPLAAALETNDNPNIRVPLAQALLAVGQKKDLALPVLLDVVQDGKLLPDLRGVAIAVLGSMGPAAKVAHPTLDRLLREDPEELLKARLVAARESIGPVTIEDVSQLREALGSSSRTVRKAAAETLSALREAAKAAVPELKQALADKDLDLRLAAVQALGAIGPDAKDAVPDLIEALKQPIPELQGRVLDALRGIGPDAKDAIKPILDQVGHKDARIRAAALGACAGIAHMDPGVQRALENGLKDKDPHIRNGVAAILWHVRGKPDLVMPTLMEALDDDSKADTKTEAIAVLAVMGPKAMAAIPRLKELAKEKNPDVSKAAAEALKAITGLNP